MAASLEVWSYEPVLDAQSRGGTDGSEWMKAGLCQKASARLLNRVRPSHVAIVRLGFIYASGSPNLR